MSLKIKIHKKRTKSDIENNSRLGHLFLTTDLTLREAIGRRGPSVVKPVDNSSISYKYIKMVDLLFEGHTGCPKCQISIFFTFLTFWILNLTLKK